MEIKVKRSIVIVNILSTEAVYERWSNVSTFKLLNSYFSLLTNNQGDQSSLTNNNLTLYSKHINVIEPIDLSLSIIFVFKLGLCFVCKFTRYCNNDLDWSQFIYFFKSTKSYTIKTINWYDFYEYVVGSSNKP